MIAFKLEMIGLLGFGDFGRSLLDDNNRVMSRCPHPAKQQQRTQARDLRH